MCGCRGCELGGGVWFCVRGRLEKVLWLSAGEMAVEGCCDEAAVGSDGGCVTDLGRGMNRERAAGIATVAVAVARLERRRQRLWGGGLVRCGLFAVEAVHREEWVFGEVYLDKGKILVQDKQNESQRKMDDCLPFMVAGAVRLIHQG
ncbi:NACHT, LRR and PYD domain-containing protein 1 isoform X4 [Sesbania bispinosa]|nr:NACHT, LRR and PYD domain-containing protein 1 isoform X4 [Sesbania bispinosa]